MIINNLRTELIKKVRRVVIKIGSSVLTDSATNINFNAFASIVDQIARIKENGIEPVIVSSGAIAIGMRKIGLKQRPQSIPLKQAAAAVGQSGLMENYERFFKEKNLKIGQVLLTNLILKERPLFLNARNTLFALLELGVIPIINENDSVIVDEIKLGDNDNLATITTNLVEADLLIILTDQDGLFEADPQTHKDVRLIPLVKKIDKKIESLASTRKSAHGVGGMETKIAAAKNATTYGVPVVIANGRFHGVLEAIFQGKDVGTLFLPQMSKLNSRKHWIAFTLKPRGKIFIDQGAEEAILKKGKSLLAIGITKAEGDFQFGDSVSIFNQHQQEIARGLVNYGSLEIKKIKGAPTKDIERILGYKYYDEVIKRDDLVVL
ncbi:MAG TPA: glutamate 5-kinase [Thermodesulfobacteriota bacterium]|nr:glutamate 5-kinase [Thermodesulfobacteriota bacterium]